MIARLLASATRLALGVRLRHDLPPPKGRRVYVANHSSHLDFVLIWAALPDGQRRRTRPVAAADYWKKGRLRIWLADSLFRAVLITRGKVERDSDPVGEMAAQLQPGEALIVFPEGTRSHDGSVGTFKPGIYRLAKAVPDLEIVPVALDNLTRILPKGAWLPVPLLGGVHFGEPVRGPLPDERRPEFLERLRRAVVELGRFQPSEP